MSFPEDVIWAQAIAEGRIGLLDELLDELPYQHSLTNIALCADLSLEMLNVEFTNSFDAGTATIPLHGRSYIGGGDQKLFEELFRFYSHFGLELDKSCNDFWPDSLQMELEFMHYMAYLETLNDGTRISILKGQRDFLRRQLVPLVEGIREKLAATAHSTYTPLVALIADCVHEEQRYLNDEIGDQVNLRQVS